MSLRNFGFLNSRPNEIVRFPLPSCDIRLIASATGTFSLMTQEGSGKRNISLRRLFNKPKLRSDIKSIKKVCFQGYIIRELENGSIEVELDGIVLLPVKPALRELAIQLNVGLLNGNGNAFNTRQLGSQIIKSIQELTTIEPLGLAET